MTVYDRSEMSANSQRLSKVQLSQGQQVKVWSTQSTNWVKRVTTEFNRSNSNKPKHLDKSLKLTKMTNSLKFKMQKFKQPSPLISILSNSQPSSYTTLQLLPQSIPTPNSYTTSNSICYHLELYNNPSTITINSNFTTYPAYWSTTSSSVINLVSHHQLSFTYVINTCKAFSPY